MSSCLLFWSVNYIPMDVNYVFVEFSIFNEWGALVISWPSCLFSAKINNTLLIIVID